MSQNLTASDIDHEPARPGASTVETWSHHARGSSVATLGDSAQLPGRTKETRTESPSLSESVSSPEGKIPSPNPNYAWAVDQFYAGLFRFGIRLTRNPNDAADLAQETYRILYTKGTHIREAAKIQGWLFTTLYRLFLRRRRHETRFPAATLESAEWDLPQTRHRHGRELDGVLAVESLGQLDDIYRLPLTKYYLEDKSYKEVANALGLPIGTVMSRLSRGKNLLRQRLETRVPAGTKAEPRPGPKWFETAVAIVNFNSDPAEAA